MSLEKWKDHLRAKRGPIRRISMYYFIVILFLLAFFLLLKEGSAIHDDLAKPQWAILIALLIIIPIIYHSIMRYFAPRLTSIKISNLVEFKFKEADIESVSLDKLIPESPDWIKTLNENLKPEALEATTYANYMTSLSSSIISAVKQIEQKEYDSLLINLKLGNTWVAANLYFFALLVAKRTFVNQIIFVETARKENEFTGMCSPEELLEGLEKIFPDYRDAAGDCMFFKRELSKDIGISYFSNLKEVWADKDNQETSHKLWLTSSSLCSLVGKHLHWDQIEHKEPLTEQDYRHILCSSHPYTAVVRNGQFLGLCNRDKVALLISRAMIEKSSIYE